MLLEIALLFAGLAVLVKASDVVVEKANILSQITHVSSLFIGFIFIAIATSLPELAVNVISSLHGEGNLGVSTLFGSNVANIALVFGIMTFFRTYRISGRDKENMVQAIILTSIISVFAIILGHMNFAFGIFTFIIFMLFAKLIVAEGFTTGSSKKPVSITLKVITNSAVILAAIAAVIISANVVTDNAVILAKLFRISESVIGATIIAVGTSLPEVAVSITAIKKLNIELAVGNIVGSLVANLTIILGIASIIAPIVLDDVIKFNIILLLAVNVIFLYMLKNEKFGIPQGIMLLSMYAVFLLITGFIGIA
jgi:cation:H+ antiporter